jgi:Luciferase-like monooxygenase
MRLGVSLAGFAAAAKTTNVAGRAVELGSQAGRPGLDSVWFAQMASYDALAVASAVGRAVPRISVGTAVVPIYPRHPQILASAAELERSELALIEAARDGGATWSRIATAMDARNRQTAQKRHADLAEIDQIMAAAVPVGGPTPEGMA